MGSIYETGRSLPAKRKNDLHQQNYFLQVCFLGSFGSETHHRPVVDLQVVCGAALAGVQGKGVNGHLDGLLWGGVQDPAAGGKLGVGAGEGRRGQVLHAGGGIQSPAAEH